MAEFPSNTSVSSPDCVFGTEVGLENCKSSLEGSFSSPRYPCPQCGSKSYYKDGLRYSQDGSSLQRWLCRDCGYRFSEKPLPQKNQEWSLNKSTALLCKRQIGVLETKNLDSATISKTVAGDIEKAPQTRNLTHQYDPTISSETRALVAVYKGWLEKEGYTKGSHWPSNLLTLVKRGADLSDPESVKVVIGKADVRNGTKMQHVYAYDAFAKMMNLRWEPPTYKQEETIPFVPDESELDQLIAACRSKRMATYLQCLKETFADPGEALRIEWSEISANIVKINHPVKGHLPRMLEVSNKLIAMLNALPRESERIFPTKYSTMYSCYYDIRKRAAEIQKNPRLLKIELRTFRHWGGTKLAYETNGNVLIVKRLLGHKRVENTMKYINMFVLSFKDTEFDVATATTVEEIKNLGVAGWVKYDETVIGGTHVHFYKKPKRFSVAGSAAENLDNKRSPEIINLK